MAVGVHACPGSWHCCRSRRLELLVDPGAVEEFHQRPVQHVDPDHRLADPRCRGRARCRSGVRMMSPRVGFAALALDIGVAALVRQDGAAGVRAVHMRGRDVAGIVDRDRAADGVGDLQAAAEAGIGQQDALPVGELDRRDVGLCWRCAAMRSRYGCIPSSASDTAALFIWLAATRPVAIWPAPVAAGVGEPGPLRRRIHLGADPDIVACRHRC